MAKREEFDYLILSDKMIFTFLKEMQKDYRTAHLFKKPYANTGTIAGHLWSYALDYYRKHYDFEPYFNVGKKRVSKIFNSMCLKPIKKRIAEDEMYLKLYKEVTYQS